MPFALAASLLLLGAGSPERLVVIDIATADGVARKMAAQVFEALLTEASRVEGLQVVGQSDLSLLLGMERQRQLLGCADEATACATELAGALDARWVLTGSLGRLGKRYRLDLKLVDGKAARVARRVGRTLDRPEELLEALPALVAELLSKEEGSPLAAEPPREEVPPPPTLKEHAPPPPAAPLPWPKLALGLSGALVGGVGAGLIASARADEASWPDRLPTLSYDEAERLRSDAHLRLNVGATMLSAGGAALAGALAWWLLAPGPSPSVAVLLGPRGEAVLAVGGHL